MIITKDVAPSQLAVGDLLLAIDHFEISKPLRVEAVKEQHAVLEPLPSGLTRRLYFDQYEVLTVQREVEEQVLPEIAHEAISDSLLLMEETLIKRGAPSTEVRRLIDLIHVFSAPDVTTEIVIRPKLLA